MTPLRVALADDEAVARRRLARLLSELPDVSVALVAESGDELLAALGEQDVDVVLLDIHMPGLDGLATHQRLGPDAPYVIYVTAHPERAVDAFDAGAIDYVLKPVEPERLGRAIDRARALLARATSPLGPPGALARLAIESRDGLLLLAPASISHAAFDGQLVSLSVDGREILTDRSLSDLELTLSPHGFERVHRRFLLNLHRVVRLEDQPSGGYLAHCDDGAEVPVSRQIARQLRRRLLGA